MERFYQDFGSRLRRYRQRSGLKQGALASAVSLSRTSITNIELGRQRMPLHVFAEVVRILEVDPQVLLSGPSGDDLPLKSKYQKVLTDRDASQTEREAVLRIDRRLEKDQQP